MVNEKDIAKLATTLQVPLIAQDILDDAAALNDDVRYALHLVLSEYQPDTALLCIALSARKIAGRFQKKSSAMAVLKMECDRIIADYAEVWLDHVKNHPIDDNVLFDTLGQIPEDLEALAELLELNTALLEHEAPAIAGLAGILGTQARAHALIADTYIDEIEGGDDALPIDAAYVDNVIPFPGNFIRS